MTKEVIGSVAIGGGSLGKSGKSSVDVEAVEEDEEEDEGEEEGSV